MKVGEEVSGARHGDWSHDPGFSLDARRDSSGGYKVDVGRGQRIGRVSSEWFSRPADERYLSLSELAHSVRDRADRSRTLVVESALIHVEANRSDPERLFIDAVATWVRGDLAERERALPGAPPRNGG
ncbi:hypothetical protein [Sphingomonas sp. DT-204]|uniref:hypothetical protein n=1 Tax=Sphingomonas sp. DT-204 TaxID=3396166 RepID=UPI003F53ED66